MKKNIFSIILISIGYLLSGYVFISSLIGVINKSYISGSFYTLTGLIILLSLSSIILISLIVISILLIKKIATKSNNNL